MKKDRLLIIIPLFLILGVFVALFIAKIVLTSFFETSDLILAILSLISLSLIFWSNKIKMHFYASYYILGICLLFKYLLDGINVFSKGTGFYTAMMVLSFIAAFLIFDYLFLETHSLLNVFKMKVVINIFSFILIALFVAMFVLEFSYVLINTITNEFTIIGLISAFTNLFAVSLPLFGIHIERKHLS